MTWRDPEWGTVGNGVAILYTRGVADEPPRMPQPRAPRPRRWAGWPGWDPWCPTAPRARQARADPEARRRLNAIFDDADVLLLPVIGEPPVPVGKWDSHSGPWTLPG